ncbi:MAG: insulinase family protein, partial [FCB group bacterium]|nr:insulinase family protein [FCB group bacterium]
MKKILITLMITAFCFGQLDLKQDVPFNSDIVYGKLPNGLTYYILKNDKPADRAELRLAVNIGSVDEEDHEQGIAHFLEHMCFNGTEKYPRNTLVDYLESLGMAFGPDLNAYTSFDRTVYMLQIPTNDHDKFISGIEIMSEWAGYVSLEGEEIDKERGVVKEEWRMRRGASARISDEQFPVLFEGSKYANRLPIGKMDVIDKMTHDDVRGYYNRWYRPDLMAFIAVGDFDVVETENMIKAQFGRIPAPENPVIPQVYDVPEHEESRVVISTDPEAQR